MPPVPCPSQRLNLLGAVLADVGSSMAVVVIGMHLLRWNKTGSRDSHGRHAHAHGKARGNACGGCCGARVVREGSATSETRALLCDTSVSSAEDDCAKGCCGGGRGGAQEDGRGAKGRCGVGDHSHEHKHGHGDGNGHTHGHGHGYDHDHSAEDRRKHDHGAPKKGGCCSGGGCSSRTAQAHAVSSIAETHVASFHATDAHADVMGTHSHDAAGCCSHDPHG